MNLNEIQQKYDKILYSIKLAKDNECFESVLILMYSMLDSLSWLNSNSLQIEKRNVKNDYINFLNKYYIKYLNINILAEEIYNARCAIVHTISGESKMKNIKSLAYSNNINAANETNDFLNKCNRIDVIAVDTVNMLEALVHAYKEFFKDINQDNNKRSNVIKKSENYYNFLEQLY